MQRSNVGSFDIPTLLLPCDSAQSQSPGPTGVKYQNLQLPRKGYSLLGRHQDVHLHSGHERPMVKYAPGEIWSLRTMREVRGAELGLSPQPLGGATRNSYLWLHRTTQSNDLSRLVDLFQAAFCLSHQARSLYKPIEAELWEQSVDGGVGIKAVKPRRIGKLEGKIRSTGAPREWVHMEPDFLIPIQSNILDFKHLPFLLYLHLSGKYYIVLCMYSIRRSTSKCLVHKWEWSDWSGPLCLRHGCRCIGKSRRLRFARVRKRKLDTEGSPDWEIIFALLNERD